MPMISPVRPFVKHDPKRDPFYRPPVYWLKQGVKPETVVRVL